MYTVAKYTLIYQVSIKVKKLRILFANTPRLFICEMCKVHCNLPTVMYRLIYFWIGPYSLQLKNKVWALYLISYLINLLE